MPAAPYRGWSPPGHLSAFISFQSLQCSFHSTFCLTQLFLRRTQAPFCSRGDALFRPFFPRHFMAVLSFHSGVDQIVPSQRGLSWPVCLKECPCCSLLCSFFLFSTCHYLTLYAYLSVCLLYVSHHYNISCMKIGILTVIVHYFILFTCNSGTAQVLWIE